MMRVIKDYRENFNHMVQKQTLHLVNQIDKIKVFEHKLSGIAAIILVGLCYNEKKNFTLKGLDHLKKIIKISLDNNGFPKSRNIKDSIFI